MQEPSELTPVPQDPPSAATANSTNSSEPAPLREESLGERNDGGFKTTFHVYKMDQQVCYYLERIYNMDGVMVRMVKRSADGRFETRFDPHTGDIERIFECYTLPDGNNLSKEKRYLTHDTTTESILVVCARGVLIRAVVTESQGLINTYQGQTEFGPDGQAAISVNHWFNPKTSKAIRREQIQWLPGGERGVTEHFFFADDGGLLNYRKTLYHPGTDRFLEETHHYEALSQKLTRKEIKSFERNADLADIEVTTFDADGNVVETAKNVISRAQLARSS